MSTGHSDLEERLTSLLREQAGSLPVPDATWMQARTASATATPVRRRPPLLALGAAATVAACLVAAAALTMGDDPAEQVRTVPAAQEAGSTPETGPPAEVTATTAVPAPASGGALKAETRQVALTADALTIDAGGSRFVTVQPLQVHSDPGDAGYTTLELSWSERGVEMRLNAYFLSDGREWWSNEIRTYDGSVQGGWITYTGDFFRRPLGAPFTGDFTIATPDPAVGRLHLANARLEAFRRTPECATATGRFVLDPGTSPITIEGDASGYGVNVRLLDTTTCQAVADQDRYAYDWDTADPGIVRVGGLPVPATSIPRHVDLTPVGKGRTTVHVTAHDPATGATVAEADLEVVVGDVKHIPAPTVTGRPPAP